MAETDAAGPIGKLSPQQAEGIVRAIGLIFSNTFLYGPEHGVTKKAIDDCFGAISRALEVDPEIVFNINDEDLLVNNLAVEQKNPLVRMFVTHLSERDMHGFSVLTGMNKADFGKMIEVMCAKPEELQQLGGFAGAVEALGIQSVRCKKIVYQQIAEDEIVISKDDLDKKVSEAAGAGVESIVAFLNGEGQGGDGAAAEEAIREKAADADGLSEMIMKAVEVRRNAAQIDMAGAETLTDLVVGCLVKTCRALEEDPAAKTQKGKKQLLKTLMLLEEQLLAKMRDMSDGELDDAAVAEIKDAIGEMEDELKIDSLASEYVKKRSAIEENERRILRFMKTKGMEKIEDTDLKDRLMESGLSMDGWKELIVKSGIAAAGGGIGKDDGGGGIAAIGRLAALLARVEKAAETKETDEAVRDSLDNIIGQIHKEVVDLAESTGRKIADLIDEVRSDEAAVAEAEQEAARKGKAPRLPRKRLLEILAEIGQEFCQPLAVINCSLDMLIAKTLGEINDSQAEMLTMASESSQKLQVLIDKLIEIAGLPAERIPDAEIQSSLYGQ